MSLNSNVTEKLLPALGKLVGEQNFHPKGFNTLRLPLVKEESLEL